MSDKKISVKDKTRGRQPSGRGTPAVPGLRAAAENKLARNSGSLGEMALTSARKVFHELQVHQIELEMQNEELKRVQVALEESRDKYLDLYDFAPVGYFTLTRAGQIAEVNLAGAALLGVGRPKLVRCGLGRFVVPHDRDQWDQHLVSVLHSDEKQTCELSLKREDGSTFDAHLDSIRLVRPVQEAVDGGTGLVIRVAMSDITQLKRVEALMEEIARRDLAEQTLQKRSEQLEAMARFPKENPDPVLRVDAKGTILYANSAAEEMLVRPWGTSVARVLPGSLSIRVAAALSEDAPTKMEITAGDRTFLLTLAPFVKAGYANLYAHDITERKRAEDVLRRTEAEARSRADEMAAIMDTMPTITFIAHDPQCRSMTSNRAAYELLRLPHDSNTSLSAPVEQRPSTFRPIKDGRELRPEELPVQRAAATGQEIRDYELTLAFEDGTHRTIYGNTVPLLDESGKPRGAVGSFVDITHRKQAETELREVQERLALTASATQIGMFDWNLAKDKVLWTEAMEAILGYAPATTTTTTTTEHDSSRWTSRVHPDDLARLEAQMHVSARERRPFQEQYRIIWPDKSEHWVGTKGVFYHAGDGEAVRMVGVAMDITERKRMEIALRQSEERLELAMDATMDGVWDWDLPSGKAFFGPPWYTMLGYEPGEMPACYETFASLVHPDDAPRIEQAINACSRQQETNYAVEFRMRTRSGDWKWILTRGKVVEKDGRGNPKRMVGTHTDLTTRKNLEHQLLQAQKMETVGQLAGGIAHDFRNQLAVIKGYAEMLQRRSLVNEEGLKKLEYIFKAVDRSATMSAQLLAFSRQQTLQPEVIGIDSVTADMMKPVAQMLGEDIRLSIMPCVGLWNVRVDIGQFQQALLNLVLNARDAMPKGGQLTVETKNVPLDEFSARQHVGASPGRYVVLTVRDAGSGIPPEMVQHLFEPFFTTKPVGEGTGLGLAMVHGFVGQSGGFVEVESQLGQGTTFRLHFPAVEDIAQPAQSPLPTTDLPQGSGTVLVVEDEDAIRRLLLETLGECGYTVLTAGNPHEAMALIQTTKEKVDLLITDVVMPGGSGPELAEHFHASRSGVPRLMISGHTGKALTEHGVISSDVNLLTKPFSAQTLAQTVQKILKRRKRK
jgi:PAS domain S-box-containing protein